MDEIESKGVFRRTKSGISGDNKIESIVSNVSRGRSLWTKLETKGLFRRAKLALVEGEEKEEIKSCRSFQRLREREKHLERSLLAKLRERICILESNTTVVAYSWTINVKRFRPLTFIKKKNDTLQY